MITRLLVKTSESVLNSCGRFKRTKKKFQFVNKMFGVRDNFYTSQYNLTNRLPQRGRRRDLGPAVGRG